MKKSILILVLIITNLVNIYSQSHIISGYVTDTKTGEILIGANITDRKKLIGTVTNNFGYYTINTSNETNLELTYSYLGYISKVVTIEDIQDTILSIELSPGLNLDEIIITHNRSNDKTAEISKVNIPIESLTAIPSLTGEADILKAYQLMPGINSGCEGSNQLFVRGGTPDQNLFLLDDVPLYNVNHLGGFYSVFNSSIVKSIDVYKGGFPARYGGRLSSVFDIRTKDGNINEYKGELGLSLLMSKIYLEGPIEKGKSSYSFSARKCNIDSFLWMVHRLNGDKYNEGYTFYDLNGKANYRLTYHDRIFFSLYHGRDKVYYNEKDKEMEHTDVVSSSKSDIKWGNTAASLRWLHVTKNNIFNNITLAYTKYIYANNNLYTAENASDNTTLEEYFNIQSEVNNIFLKSDTEINFKNSKILLGASITKSFYIPTNIIYSDTSDSLETDTKNSKISETSLNLSSYAEYHFTLLKKIKWNIGLNAGAHNINSFNYYYFEPRIIMSYYITPAFTLNASYCKMNQDLHFLTNSNAGLPTDIWVPSTKNIPPSTSNQYTIGLKKTFEKDIEASVEVFDKTLTNLIDYKEGSIIYSTSNNWDEKIEKDGTGKVSGIEFLLRKKEGIISGWIGYALNSNTRNFKNINNGNTYTFKYEQKHNLSAVFIYRIKTNLSLSATWVYHTGNYITLPLEKYDIYDIYYEKTMYGDINEQEPQFSTIHIYSEKNGYKMPDYHRLDFGLNYSKPKKRGDAIWSINVYNAYNRQNAYYLYFKESSDGSLRLYQKSLFPLLVNIGYSFKF